MRQQLTEVVSESVRCLQSSPEKERGSASSSPNPHISTSCDSPKQPASGSPSQSPLFSGSECRKARKLEPASQSPPFSTAFEIKNEHSLSQSSHIPTAIEKDSESCAAHPPPPLPTRSLASAPPLMQHDSSQPHFSPGSSGVRRSRDVLRATSDKLRRARNADLVRRSTPAMCRRRHVSPRWPAAHLSFVEGGGFVPSELHSRAHFDDRCSSRLDRASFHVGETSTSTIEDVISDFDEWRGLALEQAKMREMARFWQAHDEMRTN